VVADVNWPIFKELFESRRRRPFLERVGIATAAAGEACETDLAQELRALDPRAMRVRIAGFVQQQVAAVLGWSHARPPDPWRGFFDLGMDSLMALDLKNRLQAALGLPLRGTVVFNHSTVNALAEFLALQLAPSSTLGRPAEPVLATRGPDTGNPGTGKPETPAHADPIGDAELLRLIDEQLEAIERGAPARPDHV
jgi:acyl carrier protein